MSALEWRYALLSALLLPLIDLSLRFSGFAVTRTRVDRWFGASGDQAADADGDDVLAQRIARAVSLAGRRSPWPTSCLRQALLLKALLARRGMGSELKIGVRNQPGEGFGAHAWVERRGRVLIGGEHASQQYVAMN